jgi:hypothetical protein
MSTNVFANGREVSCKKSDNESIAAMPDVCLSPPSPPAGPVPIPYPNFSQASDTSDGTKTVKIGGDEVGMKDQSNYKKSKGDEAATRSFGMSVVTHTIQGKTYFLAWSSDVMFEGANAVRFMDMTSHNHGSEPGSGVTANKGKMTAPVGDPLCVKLEIKLREAEQKDTKLNSKGKPRGVESGQVLSTSKHSTLGFMKSASQSMMKSNINSDAIGGYLERPQRVKVGKKTKEPKVACTDSAYNGWTCNSGHAEGKAIQKIFAKMAAKGGMGGTLTLRIRWNDKGKIRQEPCPACKSAICKTSSECDMKIEICTEEKGVLKKKAAPCDEGKWDGEGW